MEVIQADGGSGSLSSTPELDKVAPFLIKLFEIVSSQASDDLVCWSEHGETFKIVHRTKFAGEVLPLYFKHDNLRSFIRQLNIYGFQRCPNASGRDRTMEFFHPMFTRNGARNLKEIKRGNQASKKHDLEDSKFDGFVDDAEPAGPAVKKARVDYSAFKADVSRLQKNLENFENDLKEHSMQVQQKLAFILSALDEAAVPPQAPPAAANGSPAPMPAARDLQPHGATADALAAAAATAMPTSSSSSSPPVDAGAPAENGAAAAAAAAHGCDGPEGSGATAPGSSSSSSSSSRDLAAAYLSAAGHTNPSDVLGGGLPGNCGLPNGLPHGFGGNFGGVGLASAAGLLGAAAGASQPLGGLSAAGLSAINSAANLPLGLQAQRLQLGRHGGALGALQMQAAGCAAAAAPSANGEAQRRYQDSWWGDGWGAMPASGGDGLGPNGGGLHGLHGGVNGGQSGHGARNGGGGALHAALNGALNGAPGMLPDEQQKMQLALLHGLHNGGGALPFGIDGHHHAHQQYGAVPNNNGSILDRFDLKRILAAQAHLGAGTQHGHLNGHINGHINGLTNGHAKLEAQELQQASQA